MSKLLARNERIVRIARTAAPIEFRKTLLDQKAACSGLDVFERQVEHGLVQNRSMPATFLT